MVAECVAAPRPLELWPAAPTQRPVRRARADDFVSIVACNRSNGEFTRRIRKQLFDAIMRQDTVYFELNASGAVCDRLNGDCHHVAHSFLHLPREILLALASVASAIPMKESRMRSSKM